MRYETDIQIDKLIVHILDPKLGWPILSWRDIPLTGNKALSDYFTAHIRNSLQDSATKAARFIYIDKQNVPGISKELLNGNIDFGSCPSFTEQEL
jgi:hypothetical protein